ncbi:hypothetical protein KEM54_002464 [Ascosphaera aggregata]|nr:hypothetical protein KEM54_002464 [Ascosphaera aggregata]
MAKFLTFLVLFLGFALGQEVDSIPSEGVPAPSEAKPSWNWPAGPKPTTTNASSHVPVVTEASVTSVNPSENMNTYATATGSAAITDSYELKWLITPTLLPLGDLITQELLPPGNLTTQKLLPLGDLITQKLLPPGNPITLNLVPLGDLTIQDPGDLITQKSLPPGNLTTQKLLPLGDLITQQLLPLGNPITLNLEPDYPESTASRETDYAGVAAATSKLKPSIAHPIGEISVNDIGESIDTFARRVRVAGAPVWSNPWLATAFWTQIPFHKHPQITVTVIGFMTSTMLIPSVTTVTEVCDFSSICTSESTTIVPTTITVPCEHGDCTHISTEPVTTPVTVVTAVPSIITVTQPCPDGGFSTFLSTVGISLRTSYILPTPTEKATTPLGNVVVTTAEPAVVPIVTIVTIPCPICQGGSTTDVRTVHYTIIPTPTHRTVVTQITTVTIPCNECEGGSTTEVRTVPRPAPAPTTVNPHAVVSLISETSESFVTSPTLIVSTMPPPPAAPANQPQSLETVAGVVPSHDAENIPSIPTAAGLTTPVPPPSKPDTTTHETPIQHAPVTTLSSVPLPHPATKDSLSPTLSPTSPAPTYTDAAACFKSSPSFVAAAFAAAIFVIRLMG